jgi:hypothetical protein
MLTSTFYRLLAVLSRFALFCTYVVTVTAFVPAAYGQLYTASINGTVRDASGSVIPNANLVLTNVGTTVERRTTSNDAGIYVFRYIEPGTYTLEASNAGFATKKLSPFTLVVNQTATFDFSLSVSPIEQSVTVEAVGAGLQASTSELGSVVSKQEVEELPLNGRNFTQLLTLTPGASPVNVAQSSFGIFAPITNQSQVAFPSINGQANRSNYFYLDGINNQGSFASMYAVPPIIDAIQEFKIQSHNDSVQFGGSTGGIINVVSKSGTNDFHGALWEFLRNDAFDARNTFQRSKTPLRYNMYGASVGGPVLLPHYNGRNKTFFFAAWQGFRFRQPAQSFYRVPTENNLRGDLSDWPQQIYNPFTTRENPSRPGTYIRDPFPGNIIPPNLLNSGMVYYAQNTLSKPVFTGVADRNAINTVQTRQSEEDYTIRLDQTLGTKDSLWFRYSGLVQPTTSAPGREQIAGTHDVGNKNYGISWVHTFSPTTLLQVQFGHSQGYDNQGAKFVSLPANFAQTVGWSNQTLQHQSGALLIPQLGVDGFFGGGENNTLNPNITDIYQYRADASKIRGNHTFQWGGEFSSDNFEGIYESPQITFRSPQTSDPLNPGQTGSSLASFLLGIPDQVWKRNVHETTRFGGVMGFYFMDKWKATQKLTVNLGLRYDRKFQPPYGTEDTIGQYGGIETGQRDLTRGIYILQRVPPTCAVRGHAPCLPDPTGKLPDHVFVDPRGKIYHDSTKDFQPRLGLAYRLNDKIAIRSGFGIVFEEWADNTQQAQNAEGNWPDTGNKQLFSMNQPNSVPGVLTPSIFVQDPWPNILPDPSPWVAGASEAGLDPYAKTEYSMQWNLGVEYEIAANTVLRTSYVGSGNRRGRVMGWYNTALTPGPGNPQERALYPYSNPNFYSRSWGRSNYNAFQLSLNRKFRNGLAYVLNYTWSKSIDTGCSGYENPEGCNIQDPYHFNNDRSVSAFDLPHIFTANWLYELPFGTGKPMHTGNRIADYIFGNWQINGIVSFNSGTPYNLNVPGDIANIGAPGAYERYNLAGDVKLSHPTPQRWFNTDAFQTPALLTFGNMGRNVSRSDGRENLDLSLFREFPFTESKRLQFRAEAFNAFNHVIYGFPAGVGFLGTIAPNNPNFGRVLNTANRARQIQLSLKFLF